MAFRRQKIIILCYIQITGNEADDREDPPRMGGNNLSLAG